MFRNYNFLTHREEPMDILDPYYWEKCKNCNHPRNSHFSSILNCFYLDNKTEDHSNGNDLHLTITYNGCNCGKFEE